MNINATKIDLKNSYPENNKVLIADVSPDLFIDVKTQINNILSKRRLATTAGSMSSLAGQLTNQLMFSPRPNFIKFMQQYVEIYADLFESATIKDTIIKKHETWLNLQAKHDYNPNHIHSGNLSYVLWVKIPFEMEEEDMAANTKKSNCHTHGRFEFSYVTKDLQVDSLIMDIDKTYEGKMILFPANLRHCVYPFYTSDKERMSIAGNIWI